MTTLSPNISPNRALLWKDFRVLMPLAVAVGAMALVLYAATILAPGERDAAFYSYLILLPNLVAFGAPSLLIGHEEEQGTLQWQQAMPTSWLGVFATKFLVALVATLLVWCCCAVGIWLAYAGGHLDAVNRGLGAERIGLEAFRMISYTVLLLSTSLWTAWLTRQPAAGLLLVVPLMLGLALLGNWLGKETGGWVTGEPAYYSDTASVFWTGVWQYLLAGVVGCLAAGEASRRWFGRKAWYAGWLRSRGEAGTAAAWRPPATALDLGRPKVVRALVWQSVSQAKLLYWGAVSIGVAGVVTTLFRVAWGGQQGDQVWLIFASILVCWLLGVATFVGDVQEERYRFLAHRGIGRWTVWWTRVAPPASAVVFWLFIVWMVFAWALAPRMQYMSRADWVTGTLAGFAGFGTLFIMGMLSSMWARRPMVGYMGAPLLMVVAMFWGGTIYQLYEEYLWTALLGQAVLVGASVRMCRRWLEGSSGPGYHARFVGWIALAALVVVLPIAGHRWSTTPAAMPEWRASTFAAAQQLEWQPGDAGYSGAVAIRPRYVSAGGSVFEESDIEAIVQAAAALESGECRWLRAVDVNFGAYLPSLLQYLRMEDRSEDRVVRYESAMRVAASVVNAVPKFPTLQRSDLADRCEFAMAAELSREDVREFLGAERHASYVEQLRTESRRQQDRKMAMLVSWAFANTGGRNGAAWVFEPRELYSRIQTSDLIRWDSVSIWDWDAEVPSQGLLTSAQRATPTWGRWQLTGERVRLGRWLDMAVKKSLEQLEEGLPLHSSVAYQERMRLWAEAGGAWPMLVTADWIPTDATIASLRAEVIRQREEDAAAADDSGETVGEDRAAGGDEAAAAEEGATSAEEASAEEGSAE